MANLPPFDNLKIAYPNIDLASLKVLIGGRADADWIKNGCALRVSRALNLAGVTIPFLKGPDGKQETVKGSDGRWYIFRVRVLREFITKTCKAPDISLTGSASTGVSMALLAGHKGIVALTVPSWSDASGHFTLWDGSACVDATNYFPLASRAELWKAP